MLNSKYSFEIDAATQEQEIYSAALWAKQQLQQYPAAKSGCVIPHLNQNYLQILDVFTEVLAPESLLPGHSDPLPFHISMGAPLSHYPIINIALLALTLDPIVNPTLSVSRLLHSPFIGHAERLLQHTQLDAELRSHFETHIFTNKLPDFISKAIHSAHTLPSAQTSKLWAQLFTEQLQQLGWPGPRSLNNEESQTIERWQALLDEFSSLEINHPTLSREQALQHLTHIASQIIYQPKYKNCSIYIIDSLEATELSFDCTWVMGLETSFANLRLPIELSYAKQIYQAGQLETITDSNGPAVSPEEYIRGGSDIFKQQAACPFKAFAKHRLHANEIAPQKLGLHLMERGQILHLVLEQLWDHLEDHQRLCALTEDIIDQYVFSSIDTVLNNFQSHKPYTLKKQFIIIERQRLFELLKKWLAIEKTRPPFKVIAKELRQKIKLNHLSLNLQIDRIDELEDGSHIIIDYKTGQVTVNDCLGDRPNEPQLPLYCVNHSSPIAGVLFAQIRSNQMRLIGLLDDALQETWQEQQTQWQTTFFNLEKDFCDGKAIVDPKYRDQTCKQCTFQTLCRISEISK